MCTLYVSIYKRKMFLHENYHVSVLSKLKFEWMSWSKQPNQTKSTGLWLLKLDLYDKNNLQIN